MSTLGLLLLRLPAATVVGLMAVQKLGRHPEAAHQMWRPSRIGPRVWPALVLIVASLELTLAAAILVAPAAVVIPASTLALSSLTLYGVAASRRTGRCGCSRRRATSTPRQVAYRNAALASVAVAGALFTPRVTSETVAAAAALLGYVPGAMLVSLAVLAWSSRGRQVAERTGAD